VKDAITKNQSDLQINEEKLRKVFVGGLPQDIKERTLLLQQRNLFNISSNLEI